MNFDRFNIFLFLCLCFFLNEAAAQKKRSKRVDEDRAYNTNPEFLYGQDSLMSFFASHLVFPQEAIDKNIQGEVILRFVVNTDSSLSDIKVVKKVHPLLDQEAIRVLWLTDKLWKPGQSGKDKIRTLCQMPFLFEMEADTAIYDEVDRAARCLGAADVFATMKVPDALVMAGLEIDICNIVFVVNLDSSITDIKVDKDSSDRSKISAYDQYEKEVIRCLLLTDKKWVPAKRKDEFVRSRVRMCVPVSGMLKD